jgi:hypothetical protein
VPVGRSSAMSMATANTAVAVQIDMQQIID